MDTPASVRMTGFDVHRIVREASAAEQASARDRPCFTLASSPDRHQAPGTLLRHFERVKRLRRLTVVGDRLSRSNCRDARQDRGGRARIPRRGMG